MHAAYDVIRVHAPRYSSWSFGENLSSFLMVHHEIRNSGCQVMKLPRTLQKPSSGRPWMSCGSAGQSGGQALRKRINYVIIYIHCNRAYTTQDLQVSCWAVLGFSMPILSTVGYRGGQY
jgi:hypothetical protein